VVAVIVPEVEEARIHVSVFSPDGTRTEHHLESLSEVGEMAGHGLRLRHVDMTLKGVGGERCHLLISCSESFWYVEVDADRIERLKAFWDLLEERFGLREKAVVDASRAVPGEQGPPALSPGKLHVYCKPRDISWPVLLELPARLAKLGFVVKDRSVTIRRYPTVAEYGTLEAALKDVEKNGVARRYRIWLSGSGAGKWLEISRYRNRSDEDIMEVDFTGSATDEVVDSVISFLGLERDAAAAGTQRMERKCFVAFRFDEQGDELAAKVCRFLELLGFSVATGRGFAPRSVSEKVKARMAEQAIVFAILTVGEDKTWIVQESLLGGLSGKPLFLLKEKAYQHSGALLADHEYIPFEAPHIERAFIQVLEGLRELGFRF
jgi:hypothetical protein